MDNREQIKKNIHKRFIFCTCKAGKLTKTAQFQPSPLNEQTEYHMGKLGSSAIIVECALQGRKEARAYDTKMV